MVLIVGLGNPGGKHEYTRHNVGWLVLDQLIREISNFKFLISKQTPNLKLQFSKKFNAEVLRIDNLILTKPQTFMNDSGVAVFALTSYFKVPTSKLHVIHDDLDIKLGEYKIQLGIGPKVHNGVNSIEEKLGAKDFWRIRIGVDNRSSADRTPGEQYALQNFTDEERQILDKVIQKVVNELSLRLK